MDNPNIDNAESVKNPSPFITFTARTIPATFDTSMSYQEALFALVNYLQTQVTPAINENAEITNEQTKAINQLYDFVNHYFDNLDVQEEINNKLDEMVTDGTLDRIINQEIFGELNQKVSENTSDISALGSATSSNTSAITTLSNSVDSRIQTLTNADTTLQNNIDSVTTSVNTAIANQNAQIASLGSSTPIFVASTASMTDHSKVYVLTSNSHIYTYDTTSSDFIDTGVIYGTNTSAITNNEQIIYASNYASLLPDFDTAPINKVYHFNFASGATSIPAHMPFTTFSGGVGKLTTYSINSTVTTGAIQIYENRMYRWIRIGSGANTWGTWMKQLPGAVESYANMITQVSMLSDLDNATPNNVYSFNFASGSTSIPAHMPFSSFTGGVGTLLTITPSGTAGASTATTGSVQIYFNRNNLWQRVKGTNWGDWYPLANREFVVTSSDNLPQILTLAVNIPNAVVKLEDGDHDLYQEFMDFYGNDFFVNFGESTNPKGLTPYNGVKIIGSSSSKITFNYPGSNTYVKQLFSPITSSIGSWELDNLTIECSNCRYVVHDELGANTIAYKHTIKNCRMKIDNTNNAEWGSRACIGGGLGKSGEIEITNNYFESYGDTSAERMRGIVSYHNSAATDARSNIIFSGNYVANSDTFRISSLGSTTKMTTALVSNNSLGWNILVQQESGYYEHDNVSVTEWNNIVRTS